MSNYHLLSQITLSLPLFLHLLYKLQLKSDHFFHLLTKPPVLVPWDCTKAHAAHLTLLFDNAYFCCTPKSKTPYTSTVAFGRGALPPYSTKLIQNTHHPVRASWGGNTEGLWVNAHCCMEQGSTSCSLWPQLVQNDRAICCSAAFLCITRTNEDLITPAWALFVCFCAPVLFLSLHGPPLFRPFLQHTHIETHMQSTHTLSQLSELPLCTVEKLFW